MPQDLAELKQRIENECAQITPETVRSAINNFYVRLGCCQDVKGKHFERL